ncbi:hypothetical protein EHM69_01000 [candidate division KSB1 bacterium]|nr:MAG: hypothetical protein EHM69_01000 [candidate division KSB1 bacterium]
MKADNDFRQMEEKIYQEFNKDGALIACLGFMFVCMGVFLAAWPVLSESIPLFQTLPSGFEGLISIGATAILGYLLIWIWRRRITYPRLGYSKFVARRDFPRNWRWRAIFLFFVLIFLFSISMSLSLRLNSAVHPLPHNLGDLSSNTGSFVGIGMAVVGVILGMKRMWMIVVPMLAMIWLAAYIHVSQGWVIVLAGLLLIGIGLERLRHFLRDYPLLVNTDVQ